jgi:hypothetical protein
MPSPAFSSKTRSGEAMGFVRETAAIALAVNRLVNNKRREVSIDTISGSTKEHI